MNSMINELKENQIFVFGSNLDGRHDGGAAKQAWKSFGAEYGNGIGMQGMSYAIPTLGFEMEKLPLEKVKFFLEILSKTAEMLSNNEFLLTPIGTGIAGFTYGEIRSILPEFPANVLLVGWEDEK